MLTTNLATRPFYNVRLVRLGLAAAAAVLVALSVTILVQALSLREQEQVLTARATQAQEEASRLLREAAEARARVNPDEMAVISAAAAEANEVIEQRAFSWSRLLAHIEATLPDDVRVSAIEPAIETDAVTVMFTVESKSAEALSTFVTALEGEGTFRDVLPVSQRTANDGILDAVVQGTYVRPHGPPADRAPIDADATVGETLEADAP